jgi:hypothetical protein
MWQWLTNNGNGQDVWTDFLVLNAWTIVAIAYSHIKTHRHINRNHTEVKDMFDPDTPGGITDVIQGIKEQNAE